MEQIVEHVGEARVTLDQPRRYMVQLCKHFEHKLNVAYEDDRGSIVFPIGTCFLQAEPEVLVMRAVATTAEGLAQLQDVVGRHLLRFAFRAPPEVVWEASKARGFAPSTPIGASRPQTP